MKWFRGKGKSAPSGAEGARRPRSGSWLGRLFGARKIDNLIDENFPSWEDYSAQKVREMEEARQAEKFELPPYRVTISSPLQRNFLYVLIVGGVLGIGYAVPAWSSVLLYGAILAAFAIALFTILRDGIFLHLESHRLAVDGEWINRHTHGPGQDGDENEEGGFLKTFSRKKKTIFRSRLLQIHYQNILRAFEQGARRAWVSQDASIGEIHTLLSQSGMKVAWTIIEVLPQLGLLGTLVGLTQMFRAFQTSVGAPEVSIISGFGTALGTTVLANLFVLILRPLYVQNERSMNETLSTLQALMAIFILPTQQYAMDRVAGRAVQPGTSALAPVSVPALSGAGEQRIQRSLEQLAGTMKELVQFQEKADGGSIARETARIAVEVQSALRSFQEAVNPNHLAQQQKAFGKLTDSVQNLSEKLGGFAKAAPIPAENSGRMEHELAQMRLLTRDTLVLLEQIASRLSSDSRDSSRNTLNLKVGVHAQLYPEAETGANSAGGSSAVPERAPRPEPSRAEPSLISESTAEPGAPFASAERPERQERVERPTRTEVTVPKIRLARERS